MSQKVVDNFHLKYYQDQIHTKAFWLKSCINKCPLDAWMVQEIIVSCRPDLIIETGTWYGGSALFYASIMHLLNHGEVLTIDVNLPPFNCIRAEGLDHIVDRISFIHGRSLGQDTLEIVREVIQSKKVMVILDSDHDKSHVLGEMREYSKFVTPGQYMIVEDSNMNRHPVPWTGEEGPYEAIEEFFNENQEFVVDKRCEKFLLTYHPNGYLYKIPNLEN